LPPVSIAVGRKPELGAIFERTLRDRDVEVTWR
jgi:hypothetical protein